MAKERKILAAVVALGTLVLGITASAGTEDRPWLVAKSSGEVWVTTPGAQQASLGTETILKSGDNIRTGRNGRVLLTRGEERIMVLPNTAIGIPAQKTGEFPTTIAQQAGTILLEVEKRNVQHFEVETPYLAAVVKGTQFRVTVEKGRARVAVTRGQVQVSDFKSGQNVLVLPGQTASTARGASGGLLLSGKGQFNTIEQGAPRQTTVQPIPVPATGLRAPSASDGQEIRSLRSASRIDGASAFASVSNVMTKTDSGALRISAPIGEVTLDFKKVTDGLVHAPAGSDALARSTSISGGGSASGDSSASGASASAASGLASSGGSSAALSLGGGGGSSGLSSGGSNLGGGGATTSGNGGGTTAAVTSGASGGGTSGGGTSGSGSSGGSGLLGSTLGVVNGVVGGVTGLLKKKK